MNLRHISSILFALLLILSFGAFPGKAGAQMEAEASTGEEVALAFFYTAKTNPDFELWAKNAKEYKRRSATRAKDFIYEESQRLMRAWQDYDADRDLITVKVPVNIDLKTALEKDGEQTYWMYMSLDEKGVTYFPFKHMDYNIAVIPQMIENLMIQKITEQQFAMMQEDLKRPQGGTASLLLQLKPAKAYINQPYMIDNVEQWVLLSDIVSMTLRSAKDGAIFWNYGADWYVAPRANELRDLYKTPAGEGTESGAIP